MRLRKLSQLSRVKEIEGLSFLTHGIRTKQYIIKVWRLYRDYLHYLLLSLVLLLHQPLRSPESWLMHRPVKPVWSDSCVCAMTNHDTEKDWWFSSRMLCLLKRSCSALLRLCSRAEQDCSILNFESSMFRSAPLLLVDIRQIQRNGGLGYWDCLVTQNQLVPWYPT